jgi:hypothetical protein
LFLPIFPLLNYIIQWTAIENRTGGEGMYFFVRKSLEQYHAPKIHYTPAIEKFFKEVMDVEPEELALRLESYLVSGRGKLQPSTLVHAVMILIKFLTANLHVSPRSPMTNLISNCRTLIQDGLGE